MSYDLSSYEYPKELEEGDSFPMILHYNEDEARDVVHPIVEAIKAGEIEAVELGDDWTDDHEICCDVTVTVSGKKYGFSAWWISREGYKMLIKAEAGVASAVEELKEYIRESASE